MATKMSNREALEFLCTLREGDRVAVTQDGCENVYAVTRTARRSDGAFGSWESTRVTVSIRPGGYSRELIADGIGAGFVTVRSLTPQELTDFAGSETDFFAGRYPLLSDASAEG